MEQWGRNPDDIGRLDTNTYTELETGSPSSYEDPVGRVTNHRPTHTWNQGRIKDELDRHGGRLTGGVPTTVPGRRVWKFRLLRDLSHGG